jgi:hypothetical protein
MPVIPDTLEAYVGGSWLEISLGTSTRSYLKNKLIAKWLGPYSSGELEFNLQYHQKKKKRIRNLSTVQMIEY